VRELSNIIRKTLIFNRGSPVSAEDITQALSEKNHLTETHEEDEEKMLRQIIRRQLSGKPCDNMFDQCMDRFAAALIGETLNFTGGNRSRAAKLLGLSRPTLHSRIEKYRLKLEMNVRSET